MSASTSAPARDRLRIAIQKSGRLADPARSLLAACGLSWRQSRDKLFCFGESLPVDLLLVRDDDIPGLIADGVCDLGVVGLNELDEQAKARRQIGLADAYQPLRGLGFGSCRLMIAVPEDWDWQGVQMLQGKRIATSYPAILLGVAVLSLIAMLGFVVPQFEKLFTDMGDALPMPTRLVMGLGQIEGRSPGGHHAAGVLGRDVERHAHPGRVLGEVDDLVLGDPRAAGGSGDLAKSGGLHAGDLGADVQKALRKRFQVARAFEVHHLLHVGDGVLIGHRSSSLTHDRRAGHHGRSAGDGSDRRDLAGAAAGLAHDPGRGAHALLALSELGQLGLLRIDAAIGVVGLALETGLVAGEVTRGHSGSL